MYFSTICRPSPRECHTQLMSGSNTLNGKYMNSAEEVTSGFPRTSGSEKKNKRKRRGEKRA